MKEQTIEDLGMLFATIGFTGVALINSDRTISLLCLASTAGSFLFWLYRRGKIAYHNMPAAVPAAVPAAHTVTPQTWQYKESSYTLHNQTARYTISNELRRLNAVHGFNNQFRVEFGCATFYGYFAQNGGSVYLHLWCDDSGFTDYGNYKEYFGVYRNLDAIIHYITMHIFFG